MPERIPLFPLGAVLYPGDTLPLHVFEERYRLLVARLTAIPDPEARVFGVVAIRLGRESGVDGVSALHEVGCAALVVGLEPYPDGRSDLLTRGTRRFRLYGVDDSEPYLQGDVEWLDEPVGDAADVLAAGVRRLFGEYRAALAEVGMRVPAVALSADPVALSYAVATTTVLDLADRQALLAAPDAAARLGHELQLLRREAALVDRLPSLPGVDYARQPAPPN